MHFAPNTLTTRYYYIAQGTIFNIYIQYLVINYNEKESEKLRIYIYMFLNHFAVHQKLTQHCKSIL